jgi:SAM-dependent methyltransferase
MDITKARDLYNTRYEQYGRDIKTVGWGSAASQIIRFEALFRGLDAKSKTILDVGCGLADLVPFLGQRTGGDFRYIGIDVAGKLVENAREIYGNDGIEFFEGDIFSLDLPSVDIAVLSGALSLKVDGIEEYAYETMCSMLELSNEAACLNYLSKYVDYELEKNQHYQPEVVFAQAMKICGAVNLLHDYPLHEFTVQLLKGKANSRSE